ncbi:DUF2855 family protein [Pseudomonas sp. UL073]|uniref:DUF2855 family protein n=1 Tax=Zestomonas insulae TaxID=2809017 RepID=A0ABS2IE05_9GAMM|nr:DUF2855 family protein [Pseudomonas insulae]MBM7061270.1 DUF2855 family protein [Pseudomonas insulae]
MSDALKVTRLVSNKSALQESRLVEESRSATPAAGEIILRVERLALTTNNITYAAFGEAMQYWGFFPSGLEGWGHMPAWGYADVIASTVEGVAVGERFYGYFPIANYVWMQPERVTDRGFYDGAAHRRELTSAYNQYTRCSWDTYYRPHTEDLQILLKPLFLTSAMLADFLRDNAFFGARRLIVSSASSKTAFGTAVCLQDAPGVQLIGLTAAGNRAFVERLGCYQQVVGYDELEQLSSDEPTLYVDFSSNLELRERVHRHFGASLVYSCLAGSAQSAEVPNFEVAMGPRPQLFFAPVQLRKRNAEWGPQEVSRYIGDGLVRFYGQVSEGEQPWLRVVEHQGVAAAEAVIARLYHGQVAPTEGHVVVL